MSILEAPSATFPCLHLAGHDNRDGLESRLRGVVQHLEPEAPERLFDLRGRGDDGLDGAAAVSPVFGRRLVPQAQLLHHLLQPDVIAGEDVVAEFDDFGLTFLDHLMSSRAAVDLVEEATFGCEKLELSSCELGLLFLRNHLEPHPPDRSQA